MNRKVARNAIRILSVDDHRLFRVGLRKLLDPVDGFAIVAEADSGEAGVAAAREHRPNVVLMDLMMPGIGGLEATRRICALSRDIRVVALTACAEAPFPAQLLKAGAAGYVTKHAAGDELVHAIRRVSSGRRYVSADVAQALAFTAFDEGERSPFDALSARELQIMMMVVNCQKVADISDDLHLSPKTVNSYRYRIFEKLNVSSDVELAMLAIRHGMLDPRLGRGAIPPAAPSHGPIAAGRSGLDSATAGRT